MSIGTLIGTHKLREAKDIINNNFDYINELINDHVSQGFVENVMLTLDDDDTLNQTDIIEPGITQVLNETVNTTLDE